MGEKKGSTIIMMVIFIAVAILVFAMIGGGFGNVFSGSMGNLEGLLNDMFGSFDFGGENIKLKVNAHEVQNKRRLLNVKVLSKGENIFDTKIPSKLMNIPDPSTDLFIIKITYKNKLGQEVKAVSEEFNISSDEKANFSGVVKKDIEGMENREGKFQLAEASVSEEEISVKFPDYKGVEEFGEKEGETWPYQKAIEIKPKETWGEEGKILVDKLEVTLCGYYSKKIDPAFMSLVINITSKEDLSFEGFPPTSGHPLFFANKVDQKEVNCDKNSTCLNTPNILKSDKKRSAFKRLELCESEDNSNSKYFGWEFQAKSSYVASKESLKMTFTIYGSSPGSGAQLSEEGVCKNSDKSACILDKKLKLSSNRDDWSTGPYELIYKYQKTCPAGYEIEEGEKDYRCEKLEKWEETSD